MATGQRFLLEVLIIVELYDNGRAPEHIFRDIHRRRDEPRRPGKGRRLNNRKMRRTLVEVMCRTLVLLSSMFAWKRRRMRPKDYRTATFATMNGPPFRLPISRASIRLSTLLTLIKTDEINPVAKDCLLRDSENRSASVKTAKQVPILIHVASNNSSPKIPPI